MHAGVSGIKLNDGPTYSYLFLLVGAGAFIICGLAILGSVGVLVKNRVVWLIGFTESDKTRKKINYIFLNTYLVSMQ